MSKVQSSGGLHVPLTLAQVEAANLLHDTMDQWKLTDRALQTLATLMPGWSDEESLIKCVSVNTLYGTQVFAIVRMAAHVNHIFESGSIYPETDLVERIARVDSHRNHVSFASKLCYFFVSNRLPIYDEAARDALKFHLGRRYITNRDSPYDGFRANLKALSQAAELNLDWRRLDRYLWLVGIYRRWLKDREVNSEFRRLVSKPSSRQSELLDKLLPRSLERKFQSSRA
jgi:hypothetical protein